MIKYININKQTPLAPQFGVICIMGYIVQNRYVVLSQAKTLENVNI